MAHFLIISLLHKTILKSKTSMKHMEMEWILKWNEQKRKRPT